jgi:alkyl hydroperoxide reductase subunit AhpC
MLGVGDKFPEFKVKLTVTMDKSNAFTDPTHETYPDKWKIYFFWPKAFTFVCLHI